MATIMGRWLGEVEQLVLLALARLGDDAYGIAIQDEVAARTHRHVAVGTIYKTLWRLNSDGLVVSRVGEPTAVRGGRAKRIYRLTPVGRRVLRSSVNTMNALAREVSWLTTE